MTVFSWDKRYEISSVVVSIQLKSLRLSKHGEENDMTIGARQGMGRGSGGKRTGKRWHMRRSYSLIWYGNNKKRALKETWRNTLFSKTMIFDIWRKLRVFFIYAHLYSLMPSDLISFGKQRWFNWNIHNFKTERDFNPRGWTGVAQRGNLSVRNTSTTRTKTGLEV